MRRWDAQKSPVRLEDRSVTNHRSTISHISSYKAKTRSLFSVDDLGRPESRIQSPYRTDGYHNSSQGQDFSSIALALNRCYPR
ncbi:hypothetical protein VTK56DRAFT_9379 [Thermocarpiscus australiensis]